MRTHLLLAATAVTLSLPIIFPRPATAAPPETKAPAPATAAAAETVPFDKADAEKAVTDLATALEESFVFPDAGKKYAAMLRTNLAAGKYASFADADAFAERVTGDLQAVHKDRHLKLRPIPPAMRERMKQAGTRRGPSDESAVARAGWLADGVAYIDFRGFPGNEATLADVRKFITAHGHAKTLIIDARRNGGGGLDEMNLLFAQLYSEPTTLVVMDTRQAAEEKQGMPFEEEQAAKLRKVAGPASIVRREHYVVPATTQGPLKDAKVYLLTSKKTFSAAEHLSLSLKRTKRATLIGEATGGGAHFGGMIPMGENYVAFVPVGRTFDPDTGQSWEATGVAPDIAVSADKALDEALKLAGVSVSGEAALAALK